MQELQELHELTERYTRSQEKLQDWSKEDLLEHIEFLDKQLCDVAKTLIGHLSGISAGGPAVRFAGAAGKNCLSALVARTQEMAEWGSAQAWTDYVANLGELGEGELAHIHANIVELFVWLENEEWQAAKEVMETLKGFFPDFDPRWSTGTTGEGELVWLS